LPVSCVSAIYSLSLHDVLPILKKIELGERIVPREVLWRTAIPRMMASNNWVAAGSKTASGRAMLANDPHLEVNRLPNVWAEMVLDRKSTRLNSSHVKKSYAASC